MEHPRTLRVHRSPAPGLTSFFNKQPCPWLTGKLCLRSGLTMVYSQWDDEWMLSKIDVSRTRLVCIAFASDEEQVCATASGMIVALIDTAAAEGDIGKCPKR